MSKSLEDMFCVYMDAKAAIDLCEERTTTLSKSIKDVPLASGVLLPNQHERIITLVNDLNDALKKKKVSMETRDAAEAELLDILMRIPNIKVHLKYGKLSCHVKAINRKENNSWVISVQEITI